MLHWGALVLLLVPHSDRQFSVAGRNGRVYDAHGRGPPHVLNIYLNNPPQAWPEKEGAPNWQGHQAVPISANPRVQPPQRTIYILSVCASVLEGQGNHEGVNPATPLRVRPPGIPKAHPKVAAPQHHCTSAEAHHERQHPQQNTAPFSALYKGPCVSMGEHGGRFMGPHGRVPGWVIWAVSAAKGTPLCELYGC
jgi:hypothetical protein